MFLIKEKRNQPTQIYSFPVKSLSFIWFSKNIVQKKNKKKRHFTPVCFTGPCIQYVVLSDTVPYCVMSGTTGLTTTPTPMCCGSTICAPSCFQWSTAAHEGRTSKRWKRRSPISATTCSSTDLPQRCCRTAPCFRRKRAQCTPALLWGSACCSCSCWIRGWSVYYWWPLTHNMLLLVTSIGSLSSTYQGRY